MVSCVMRRIFYIPYIFITGITGIIGFLVMISAWLQFKKVGTAVCPTATSSKIVTNGIYKYSRNPMYLGMIIMLTGTSFFMGTIVSMIAPILMFLIIDKIFIPYEEEKLFFAFGEPYSLYIKETRRWL